MEKFSFVCPECKANVYLDEMKDTAFCSSCGVKIAVDKLVNDEENESEPIDKEKEAEEKDCTQTDNPDDELVEDEPDSDEGEIKKDDHSTIKKFWIYIAVALAFVVVILVVNASYYESSSNETQSKYENAVSLAAEGKHDEALAAFEELGDYKDSAEQINKINTEKEEKRISAIITEAEALYDSGDKIGAYKLLLPEKTNEKVADILAVYEKEVLEEANTKIEWVEDSMSDYHWAFPKNDDTVGFLPSQVSDPYFIIYLSESKIDPSKKAIKLMVRTTEYTEGFTPPVHPMVVRLRNNVSEIDIQLSIYDTDFSAGLYEPYDWEEKIDVEITLDQANTIYEMFQSEEPVKMRLIGAQRHRDFTLENDEAQAITEIVEYINVAYSVE